ncbi:MAG: response regulator [Bacteroidota bacterium]
MRGHILVIDDEAYVYEDLEYGLGQAHEIHYAANLPEINHLLREYPIDLAIVDLNIKVGDQDRLSGLEYIRTLRNKYPTLTITVHSSFSDEEKIVQATQNGADHYLIKGNVDTDSPEFRKKILKWINSKKKLDEARNFQQAESWGVGEFPKDILQKCIETYESKKPFIFVAEVGLGRDAFIEQAYRKSYAFKPEKQPDTIDLGTFSNLQLEYFLRLKHGTAQENFLKKGTVKSIYLKNLTLHNFSTQELFLRVAQGGKYLSKGEPINRQLIFFLDQDVEDLIESQALLPEFGYGLPMIKLMPLRGRKGELEILIERWLDAHKLPRLYFHRDTYAALRRYGFPGNFTEFFHILDQTLNSHRSRYRQDWEHETVHPESLPKIIHQTPYDLHSEMQEEVARIHLRYIEAALRKYEGVRSQKNLAAQELQVHSADNMKKTFINKYWDLYPDLVKCFPTIMKKYKLG